MALSLDVAPGVAQPIVALAHDPQTSGGLLAAVAETSLADVLGGMRSAGLEPAVVGRVEPASTPGLLLA